MLRVEMLPAGNGDCLWIEYGSVSEVHRILIDGGRRSTYEHLRDRILALPVSERVFELLVVTHIDNDHIEGVLPLLQDTALQCQFREVWYNGWCHLPGALDAAPPGDTLGPHEGEFLGVLIKDEKIPWNKRFGGDAVVVPEDGELPCHTLDGGMKLTLLSPTRDRLAALRDVWQKVIEGAGFRPGDLETMRIELAKRKYVRTPADVMGGVEDGPGGSDAFEERKYLPTPADVLGRVEDGPGGSDTSEANGSSIAMLAEYDGRKVLLTGDAFPDVLAASLARAGASAQNPISVELWKLAHHGSWANFTPELFALVKTLRYLVSTDGSGQQKHPHATTLNYIIDNRLWRGRPELVFNYRTATTEPWANASNKFTAIYPAGVALVMPTPPGT